MKEKEILLFYSGFEYSKYLCLDLEKNSSVYLITPFGKKIYRILRIIFSYSLFFRKSKTYKSKIWFRCFLNGFKLDKKKEYVFIFFDASHVRKNKYFLKWLKRNYDCELVVIILNNIAENINKIKEIKENFEYIYTFDPYDAQKYNLSFFYGFFSRIDVNGHNNENIDLSFVGNAKGRTKKINELIMKAKENNIFLNFKIMASDKETVYNPKFLINKKISFIEAVNIEIQSNCILDLCENYMGEQGFSLRVAEAVLYDRKLLTNNRSIFNAPFYDERYISFFSEIDEIDWSFVKRREIINYGNKELFSPVNLINRILEDINKENAKEK